jgi:protein phosphatase PTC7
MSKVTVQEARRTSLFGSEHFSEEPSDADVYSHPLAHGDVFVFATDGIWDNLSPEDVLRIVSGVMLKAEAWTVNNDGAVGVGPGFVGDVQWSTVTHCGSEKQVDLSTALACAIVREAKFCSLNVRRDGPFAKEVKRYFPFENWHGGKPDDICTVVGVVTKNGI